VQEIVDFLKNPKKYTDLGGKIPRGALLVGPPGTGKTLLAKAVAGEADVPFFSISGSDFVEMFVGVGASRVRDLFRQAKEKAPSIIFIDEIDAVGRARGKNPSMGGNDERENTLNQLLTEMDGFSPNSGVIVLAATNRVDILDKALLRAGRFDRQIHVDLPDLGERKAIFLVHMRPLKMDNTVDVDLMARQTPGFSGADIANVCNEAALIAARHNKKSIGMQDFLDAVDRIIGGLEKKTKVMTREEKHTIALHEAGHATISWFLRYANPLVKVTIVPRGQALGAAWYLPEERNITTKEQMEDEICATLGGRAAEELFTGHISTGALNDLETVTKRAYGMVAYLGMSEKLYNLCYYNNQEYQFEKPYSEKTAETIDSEVAALINRQYERAKELLMVHKEGHAQLAALLEEKEVIFAKDVENIFGKRPWASRADEILQEDNDIIEKNVAARIREDAGQKDNNDGAEDKPQDGTPSDADATPADNNTTSSGSDTTSPAPQGETTTTSAPAEEKNSPAAQDDK
jgi:cell division protease FtsH